MMFMGRFGQYTAEDIEADIWTGSVYDPGMVPSTRVTEWARQAYQPSTFAQLKEFFIQNKAVSIGAIAAVGLLFFGGTKKIKRKRRR
jgi:hypothetical protein